MPDNTAESTATKRDLEVARKLHESMNAPESILKPGQEGQYAPEWVGSLIRAQVATFHAGSPINVISLQDYSAEYEHFKELFNPGSASSAASGSSPESASSQIQKGALNLISYYRSEHFVLLMVDFTGDTPSILHQDSYGNRLSEGRTELEEVLKTWFQKQAPEAQFSKHFLDLGVYQQPHASKGAKAGNDYDCGPLVVQNAFDLTKVWSDRRKPGQASFWGEGALSSADLNEELTFKKLGESEKGSDYAVGEMHILRSKHYETLLVQRIAKDLGYDENDPLVTKSLKQKDHAPSTTLEAAQKNAWSRIGRELYATQKEAFLGLGSENEIVDELCKAAKNSGDAASITKVVAGVMARSALENITFEVVEKDQGEDVFHDTTPQTLAYDPDGFEYLKAFTQELFRLLEENGSNLSKLLKAGDAGSLSPYAKLCKDFAAFFIQDSKKLAIQPGADGFVFNVPANIRDNEDQCKLLGRLLFLLDFDLNNKDKLEIAGDKDSKAQNNIKLAYQEAAASAPASAPSKSEKSEQKESNKEEPKKETVIAGPRLTESFLKSLSEKAKNENNQYTFSKDGDIERLTHKLRGQEYKLNIKSEGTSSQVKFEQPVAPKDAKVPPKQFSYDEQFNEIAQIFYLSSIGDENIEKRLAEIDSGSIHEADKASILYLEEITPPGKENECLRAFLKFYRFIEFKEQYYHIDEEGVLKTISQDNVQKALSAPVSSPLSSVDSVGVKASTDKSMVVQFKEKLEGQSAEDLAKLVVSLNTSRDAEIKKEFGLPDRALVADERKALNSALFAHIDSSRQFLEVAQKLVQITSFDKLKDLFLAENDVGKQAAIANLFDVDSDALPRDTVVSSYKAILYAAAPEMGKKVFDRNFSSPPDVRMDGRKYAVQRALEFVVAPKTRSVLSSWSTRSSLGAYFFNEEIPKFKKALDSVGYRASNQETQNLIDSVQDAVILASFDAQLKHASDNELNERAYIDILKKGIDSTLDQGRVDRISAYLEVKIEEEVSRRNAKKTKRNELFSDIRLKLSKCEDKVLSEISAGNPAAIHEKLSLTEDQVALLQNKDYESIMVLADALHTIKTITSESKGDFKELFKLTARTSLEDLKRILLDFRFKGLDGLSDESLKIVHRAVLQKQEALRDPFQIAVDQLVLEKQKLDSLKELASIASITPQDDFDPSSLPITPESLADKKLSKAQAQHLKDAARDAFVEGVIKRFENAPEDIEGAAKLSRIYSIEGDLENKKKALAESLLDFDGDALGQIELRDDDFRSISLRVAQKAADLLLMKSVLEDAKGLMQKSDMGGLAKLTGNDSSLKALGPFLKRDGEAGKFEFGRLRNNKEFGEKVLPPYKDAALDVFVEKVVQKIQEIERSEKLKYQKALSKLSGIKNSDITVSASLAEIFDIADVSLFNPVVFNEKSNKTIQDIARQVLVNMAPDILEHSKDSAQLEKFLKASEENSAKSALGDILALDFKGYESNLDLSSLKKIAAKRYVQLLGAQKVSETKIDSSALDKLDLRGNEAKSNIHVLANIAVGHKLHESISKIMDIEKELLSGTKLTDFPDLEKAAKKAIQSKIKDKISRLKVVNSEQGKICIYYTGQFGNKNLSKAAALALARIVANASDYDPENKNQDFFEVLKSLTGGALGEPYYAPIINTAEIQQKIIAVLKSPFDDLNSSENWVSIGHNARNEGEAAAAALQQDGSKAVMTVAQLIENDYDPNAVIPEASLVPNQRTGVSNTYLDVIPRDSSLSAFGVKIVDGDERGSDGLTSQADSGSLNLAQEKIKQDQMKPGQGSNEQNKPANQPSKSADGNGDDSDEEETSGEAVGGTGATKSEETAQSAQISKEEPLSKALSEKESRDSRVVSGSASHRWRGGVAPKAQVGKLLENKDALNLPIPGSSAGEAEKKEFLETVKELSSFIGKTPPHTSEAKAITAVVNIAQGLVEQTAILGMKDQNDSLKQKGWNLTFSDTLKKLGNQSTLDLLEYQSWVRHCAYHAVHLVSGEGCDPLEKADLTLGQIKQVVEAAEQKIANEANAKAVGRAAGGPADRVQPRQHPKLSELFSTNLDAKVSSLIQEAKTGAPSSVSQPTSGPRR